MIYMILFLIFSPILWAQDGLRYLSDKSTMEVIIDLGNCGKFKYKSNNILDSSAVEFKNGTPVFQNFTLQIPSESIKSWIKLANDMLMETLKADEFPVNSVSFTSYEADGYCTGDIEIGGVKKTNEHFKAKLNKKQRNIVLDCHWHGSLETFNLTMPEITVSNIKPSEEFDVKLQLIFN